MKQDDPNWLKPRGVYQRNRALEYLRENHKGEDGLIYFMDDDNTYNVQIFKEMRKIPKGKVGVWPVGIVGKLRYEGPVCKDGQVTKWFTAWKADRPFPLDMAGFSFHLSFGFCLHLVLLKSLLKISLISTNIVFRRLQNL